MYGASGSSLFVSGSSDGGGVTRSGSLGLLTGKLKGPYTTFRARDITLPSMLQTGLIPNAHNDLVTDASYDFYGLRLATCSLDQR